MKMNTSWAALAAVAAVALLGSGCAGLPAQEAAPQAAPVAPAAPEKLTQSELDALLREADQAAREGNQYRAGNLYTRIINANPYNAQAWFKLGTANLRRGQHELASIALNEAVRQDPSLSGAWNNLVVTHLAQLRQASQRAIASGQLSAANKASVQTMLADVEQAMPQAPAGAATALSKTQ